MKPCPIPIDSGIPLHLTPETPGITYLEVDKEAPGAGEPGGRMVETARPPFLRQVINPPISMLEL